MALGREHVASVENLCDSKVTVLKTFESVGWQPWQAFEGRFGMYACRNLEKGQEQEAHPLDEYVAELIRYTLLSGVW